MRRLSGEVPFSKQFVTKRQDMIVVNRSNHGTMADKSRLGSSHFKGVFVALVTPFSSHKKESLDRQGCSKLIEFLLARDIDGIFALGSTGEGPLLKNYDSFYRNLIELIPSEVPTILHTGTRTLDQTIELSKMVEKEGKVDAIAAMPPFFYVLETDRIQQYYDKLFNSIHKIPILLYDIPQFTGNEIEGDLLIHLAKTYSNFAGIKTSTPNFTKLFRFIRIGLEYSFSVFVGNDKFIFPALCCGATGLVSGPANAFPEAYVQLYDQIKNKKLNKARNTQSIIDDYIKSVIVGGTHIARIKQAVLSRSIRLNGYAFGPPEELDRTTSKAISESMDEFIDQLNGGENGD